jgi:hypothetical protein
MTRRGDPVTIYLAQRAGVFMHLVSAERLDASTREQRCQRPDSSSFRKGDFR